MVKNVRFNSTYYQEHILSTIFKYEITYLYPPMPSISGTYPKTKASSRTSQPSVNFLEKEKVAGIKTITFIGYYSWKIGSKQSVESFLDFESLKPHYPKRRSTTFLDF
ncbi:hypothetical protein AVEN_48794-1 [Araneus ventricosus]|uniref:Uncharacterized protein n=1 Tax=Araneus ventricosus TaxID=182803 RepID=A0A4Y2IH93_ARAVE|nr:hypothetical protein AVEN_48794-1 [Araneus ventricosus]